MNLPQIVKIDLHLHLDGSVNPSTLLELANEQHVEAPAKSLEKYLSYIDHCSHCGSVNEYLKMFDLPVQVMQDEKSIIRITKELIELLCHKHYDYAEIRFAPQLHTQKGLTQDQAVAAVLQGREEGLRSCPDFHAGIICCMMCLGSEQLNWDANMTTVEVTHAYLGKGVVGLDLAGAEGIVPLRNFGPLFKKAIELGIPCTCHAGDSQGPESVRDAISFGVRRIGHGHHIAEDPALVEEAIQKGIAIEVCPTSNIQCKTQPSYGQHPAKRLLDQGLAVTINTDNMTFAGVDLDAEYEHCLRDMGFTEADLFKLSENSIKAAFMPDSLRSVLLKKLKTATH